MQVGDDGRYSKAPFKTNRQINHDADDNEQQSQRTVFGTDAGVRSALGGQFLLANRDIRNEIDARLRATLGLPAEAPGIEKGDKTEKGKPEAPEAAKKKA